VNIFWFAIPDLARPLDCADRQVGDKGDKTSILLLRTGEKKQGVVGLFQPGIPGEVMPSLLFVSWASTIGQSLRYLISLYCSLPS